jgi:Lanthionine-containing peptide SapB precursor RamS
MSLLDLQGLESAFDHTEEAMSSSLSTFHQCGPRPSNFSIILC